MHDADKDGVLLGLTLVTIHLIIVQTVMKNVAYSPDGPHSRVVRVKDGL